MNQSDLETHQAEIRALKALFETDGWQIFARDQRATIETLRLSSWDTIKTLDQLCYMKGFLAALEPVANYEALVEAREAQLIAHLAQDEDDAQNSV